FLFHSSQNRSSVIAKVDDELQEFFGFRNFFHALDCTDANVKSFQSAECHNWFYGSWLKVGHGYLRKFVAYAGTGMDALQRSSGMGAPATRRRGTIPAQTGSV